MSPVIVKSFYRSKNNQKNKIFTPFLGGNRVALGIHTKLHAIQQYQGLQPTQKSEVNLRLQRFALQETAKNCLPDRVQRGNKFAYVHRVNYCLRAPISKQKGVTTMYNTERQTAHYGNLQRCASVWNCPVCSATISEGRRNELKQGIDQWTGRGGHVYLVTFTNRHHVGDDLEQLLQGQKKAFVKFWQKRKVTENLKKLFYVGRIVATEVTWGASGWHPHYHMLFFFEREINPQALQSLLAIEWQDVCIKSGLKAPTIANGVDVRDGSYASQYATKWGLDHEMTKGHTKKGLNGGLTPFDLLRGIDDNPNYKGLFKQFADAFKGKQQLHWSNGLKELLGIEQKSDDDIIAETEKTSEYVRELTLEIWYLVVAYQARAKVLDLIEQDYLDGGGRVDDFVLELANKYIAQLKQRVSVADGSPAPDHRDTRCHKPAQS